LNGTLSTIIGVLPVSFADHEIDARGATDFWRTLHADELNRPGRRNDFLRVIGRLKPGVSLPQASAEMTTISRRLAQQYPALNAAWTLEVVPIAQAISGDARRPLWLLLASAALLLLIGCANVANLALALATERQREFAIRAALGGGQARLFRQLITESVLLSLLGGAAGLVLAYWTTHIMIRAGGDFIPRSTDVRLARFPHVRPRVRI
jgi:putative ABC transport system permease protein